METAPREIGFDLIRNHLENKATPSSSFTPVPTSSESFNFIYIIFQNKIIMGSFVMAWGERT